MQVARRETFLVGLMLLLNACDRSPFGHAGTDAADQAQPHWTRSTARQLRDAIDNRAAHGLDRVGFDAGGKPGSDEGDAALTRAALAYARALAQGATNPAKLYDLYTIPRPHPDLKQGLAAALAKKDVAGWLESLAPQDGNYRRLSSAYLGIVRQASAPVRAIPDAGKTIVAGSADPRVPHRANNQGRKRPC